MVRTASIVVLLVLSCCSSKRTTNCPPEFIQVIDSIQFGSGNSAFYETLIKVNVGQNCTLDSSDVVDLIVSHLNNVKYNLNVRFIVLYSSDAHWNYGETLSQDWIKMNEFCIAEVELDTNLSCRHCIKSVSIPCSPHD
jgi:hypothetical protein